MTGQQIITAVFGGLLGLWFLMFFGFFIYTIIDDIIDGRKITKMINILNTDIEKFSQKSYDRQYREKRSIQVSINTDADGNINIINKTPHEIMINRNNETRATVKQYDPQC